MKVYFFFDVYYDLLITLREEGDLCLQINADIFSTFDQHLISKIFYSN